MGAEDGCSRGAGNRTVRLLVWVSWFSWVTCFSGLPAAAASRDVLSTCIERRDNRTASYTCPHLHVFTMDSKVDGLTAASDLERALMRAHVVVNPMELEFAAARQPTLMLGGRTVQAHAFKVRLSDGKTREALVIVGTEEARLAASSAVLCVLDDGVAREKCLEAADALLGTERKGGWGNGPDRNVVEEPPVLVPETILTTLPPLEVAGKRPVLPAECGWSVHHDAHGAGDGAFVHCGEDTFLRLGRVEVGERRSIFRGERQGAAPTQVRGFTCQALGEPGECSTGVARDEAFVWAELGKATDGPRTFLRCAWPATQPMPRVCSENVTLGAERALPERKLSRGVHAVVELQSRIESAVAFGDGVLVVDGVHPHILHLTPDGQARVIPPPVDGVQRIAFVAGADHTSPWVTLVGAGAVTLARWTATGWKVAPDFPVERPDDLVVAEDGRIARRHPTPCAADAAPANAAELNALRPLFSDLIGPLEHVTLEEILIRGPVGRGGWPVPLDDDKKKRMRVFAQETLATVKAGKEPGQTSEFRMARYPRDELRLSKHLGWQPFRMAGIPGPTAGMAVLEEHPGDEYRIRVVKAVETWKAPDAESVVAKHARCVEVRVTDGTQTQRLLLRGTVHGVSPFPGGFLVLGRPSLRYVSGKWLEPDWLVTTLAELNADSAIPAGDDVIISWNRPVWSKDHPEPGVHPEWARLGVAKQEIHTSGPPPAREAPAQSTTVQMRLPSDARTPLHDTVRGYSVPGADRWYVSPDAAAVQFKDPRGEQWFLGGDLLP